MEIPSYFRRYLQNIQPTRVSRERAVQLHRTLADRLRADPPFRDWFDGTFLYGSYRRNTAIQPIKDVDICVLLDIDPTRDEHKPATVVNRLRRVLERSGYQGKTAPQRRSVRIDMSGTTLDVVPVVALDGDDQPLLIPDRKLQRWVETHPKGHIAAAVRLNRESNTRYIPFVKLVKAWFRYQMAGVERPKPKGFTLEALVAQYQDPDAPSYAEAFVRFLDNLWAAHGPDLLRGTFPDVADPGLPGRNLYLNISESEAEAFGELVSRTRRAARCALEEDTLTASAWAWHDIFGPKFPQPPTRAVGANQSTVYKALEDEEGEGNLDDEIADIDLPQARALGTLRIRAEISPHRDGPFKERYPSGGRSLPKDMWLRFSIDSTDVSRPFSIRWIVSNHGREAIEANDMGHTRDPGDWHQKEQTKYRGSHTMTCELYRDGVVLARAKHCVNIR